MKGIPEKLSQTVNLAKVTRPIIQRLLLRKRLFDRLQFGDNTSVIWISGPAGSGKTTLVSHYIESLNRQCVWYKMDSRDEDLATFYFNMKLAVKRVCPDLDLMPIKPSQHNGIQEDNHNFFSTVFAGLTVPAILVFDNYHEISEEIILHDLLLEAFNILPAGMQVIIISRKEPAAKYSRLRANRRMDLFGWQDIRFTLREFRDVIRNWGIEDIPEDIVDEIYQRLDGWIAGLIFMLEGTKNYNTNIRHVGIGVIEDIFNYFSEEVYGYLDYEVKHFLQATALIPYITEHLAQQVSGKHHSERTLACLIRHNMFLERNTTLNKEVYQYVPIFREYLLRKFEESHDPKELNAINSRTANLLLAENQIAEAINLLVTSGDWETLISFVNKHAPELIKKQQFKVLKGLLDVIPPEKALMDAWLSYWDGICLFQKNPVMAQACFMNAFKVSCEQKNSASSYAAWIGLVRTIVTESNEFTKLDSLIDWLEKSCEEELRGQHPDMLTTISAWMIEALMIRRPYSQQLAKWLENLSEDALMSLTDPEYSLQSYNAIVNYYLWQGEKNSALLMLEKAKSFSQSHKVLPLSLLRVKCLEAQIQAWYLGDSSQCLQNVKIGLDIAESSGIHAFDHELYACGIFAYLLENNYVGAANFLQKFEAKLDTERKHCHFLYNYLSAWVNIQRGNVQQGLHFAKRAQDTAKNSGHIMHKALAHFVRAFGFFENGNFKDATCQLNHFNKLNKPINSSLFTYLFFLTRAYFSENLGKEQVGVKYLRRAMKLGREKDYSTLICWWNPKVMIRLSMKALEREIEVPFVKDIIEQQGLTPAASPIEIEQWPWPIKIYTLGRFEIVRNQIPLRFKGKAQQKPLAMLKALISLGGRNVSEFQLADVMWPDADGDMQLQSLATTLHRLRKILGEKDMIEYQDSHLSINARYTWVDVWAFERLLSQAEAEAEKGGGKSSFFAARYAERAINFYKGSFLPQNNMDYWSIHLRERLKSRFLRGVVFLGRNLEKIDERDKAVLHYHKALEIDPLVEEFYQRLMICYHRMGRDADAVRIFKSCEKNLRSLLNVEPSVQTEAILKNLVGKSLIKCNRLKSKKEKILHL